MTLAAARDLSQPGVAGVAIRLVATRRAGAIAVALARYAHQRHVSQSRKSPYASAADRFRTEWRQRQRRSHLRLPYSIRSSRDSTAYMTGADEGDEHVDGFYDTCAQGDRRAARRHVRRPPSDDDRHCQFGGADQGGHEAHRSQDSGDVHALSSYRGQAGARCGRVGGQPTPDYR